MSDSTPHIIARRLRALREDQGFTQEALAERLGFNHRQTLASIEAGERAISPAELARAVEALGVDIDELTDPFRLVGEGQFSFRAEGVAAETLDAFQDQAGRWIATFRTLLDQAGTSRSHLGRKLELTRQSRFEDAHAAAEEMRQEWKLGDVPAAALPATIERELGAQVLFVDAPPGISGAAIHLPSFHTILVNRCESAGRRHFDVAHELFHLMTWDVMEPDRVEPHEIPPRKGNRVERLAENFAGALLMPRDVVDDRWHHRGEVGLHHWLNRTATALGVTSLALKWRLAVLGHLTKAEAEAVEDGRLVANGGLDDTPAPPPFSRRFVTLVYHAVEEGRLSLRKATRILALSSGEFGDLCGQYGLDLSYEV